MAIEKNCGSCGMPLKSAEDFGGGKLDNDYCVYCTNTDGNLKSRDQIFEGMKNFIMKNMIL